MLPDRSRSRMRLNLEALEERELLSSAFIEGFRTVAGSGLPGGWTEWSNEPGRTFQVEPSAPGYADPGELTSVGRSSTMARTWVNSTFTTDVETRVAIHLTSLVPVELIVRGEGLETSSPTYYAVTILRGLRVELSRVSGGNRVSLGSLQSVDYLSGPWITVSLRAEGSRLSVFVQRSDTEQFLQEDGRWTRSRKVALEVTDTRIRSGRQVGLGRLPRAADRLRVDNFQIQAAGAVEQLPVVEERFQQGQTWGVPSGWVQWTEGNQRFQIRNDGTLRQEGGSAGAARAWLKSAAAADVQVSASIFVDSLLPAGVMARGHNLGTSQPTMYLLTVTRGLEIKLWRVVDGTAVELGSLRSRDWLSGIWVQTSLIVEGSTLRVQIVRADTGRYLQADGQWGVSPSFALVRSDTAIQNRGHVGLSRGAGYAGELIFDNFILTSAPPRLATPIHPTEQDKPTTPSPPAEDSTPVPVRPPVTSPPPLTGEPPGAFLPTVPRTYDWIRVANLAYHGTPLGPIEQSLLQAGVDLVIPNVQYLEQIEAISPGKPQFLYTNLSNIYLSLLTDWNEYADRRNLDRESAFYHVREATVFRGSSPSSIPVNRFWGVYRGHDATGWQDLTRDARLETRSFSLAGTGEAVAFGYLERFREINIQLRVAASAGWRGRWEYVAGVDARGRPTLWKPLPLGFDGSVGFSRDGTITFDPPPDWVAATISGSARLFYVRIRSEGGGAAPQLLTVLGRDYTQDGRIPAFDYNADRDGDGYLNDAEYARRRPGYNARFVYESRLFYPYYGSMRYATNIAASAFRAWAVDYHLRLSEAFPIAAGFFVDNSMGRLAVDPAAILERLDGYAADYGSLLGLVNKRLATRGKWLIANTSGGNASAEPIIRNGVSYLEEFGLRPLSANLVQFEDLAATVAYRRQISGGRAYEILDSLPSNGFDANDPRLQLATLAMYYLIADPDRSFLMINGGNEPSSSWNRHWIAAITFDVGRPRGNWSVLAAGQDPSDSRLGYKVYQRVYDNALVLYKPLSYTRGVTGTTGDATATRHILDGWYRPLGADGSLGRPTNQILLRNGEGAILVRA